MDDLNRIAMPLDTPGKETRESARLAPGRAFPLGASADGDGVNFAIFSKHATTVSLCIFSDDGARELRRLPLPMRTDDVWHGSLAGARPGLVYGYRIDGPREPERGHRFDPSKLLIDPYARRFAGEFRWSDAHHSIDSDNARDALKCAVVGSDEFDWGDDRPPAVPLAESILYEVHIKGFTARHPDVPESVRGTYEGFVSEPALAHLRRLGVTAVSLLPVHQSISERRLVEQNLSNYWGYNTIGFFAPDRRFARQDAILEFKSMVKRLHAAGIEVILDVVYNHTAEGDHAGPTLAWKGIDNASYYHLRAGHPGFYENYTGTGNALNLNHPRVLQMVMDSLRFWVDEMHVDGFRFDLATTLGRGDTGFDPRATFFDCVRQDPVLARVKLIAEPWDVGFDGHQTGRFPAGWCEWNDRFRDSVRAFWVRKAAYRGELASRLAGSSDLFKHNGRRPQASVNYVAAHDGFTLQDVVSYDRRHNEANGEDNHDGQSGNRSWNCGVEGPTDLLAVNALRGRMKRALLATLLLSQGTPMLLAGDEFGRTQRGNNNAYCHDSELSWIDWDAAAEAANARLAAFTARLISLRRQYSHLRRIDWLIGAITGSGFKDVLWLNRQGEEMVQRQWEESGRYAFGLQLGAASDDERNLLLLLNAEATDWTMPLPAGRWRLVLDTDRADGIPLNGATEFSGSLAMKGRTLAMLEELRLGEPGASGERSQAAS